MMRRFSIAALAAVLLVLLIPVFAAGAPASKTVACHMEGNGTFIAIEVADPAVAAHLDHGDSLVGDPVPGMEGFVFGEDCGAVLAVGGYAVTGISGNTSEGGGVATFTVVLNAQPTADVTVNFDSNDLSEGMVGMTSLVFTDVNWNAPQTVTVIGVDDFVQDGDRPYAIVFAPSTSTDSNYDGTTPGPNIPVINTDND